MRKILLAASAALALASLATPAVAQYVGGRYYGQGGVVPCSADDYSFVRGRWVSNCRGGGHVSGGRTGGYSSGSSSGSGYYYRNTTVTPGPYLGSCLENRRTGQVVC